MIQQIKLKVEGDGEIRLRRFLRDRVRSIREGLKDLHENRLLRWRRIYEAMPLESVREFPFHGASNLVVPIAAIHSDTLLARVMAAVWKTRPLWKAEEVGEYGPEFAGFPDAIQDFLGYEAVEPQELDLYQVYHEWFGQTIRNGTGIVKSPWERELEAQIVPSGDGSGEYETHLIYEGPRPSVVSLDCFGINPSAKKLETTDFIYHKIKLQRQDLEDRRFRKLYDAKAVAEVLKVPDRTNPDTLQSSAEMDAGARQIAGYGFEEWDIYECWFKYRIGKRMVRLIVWYHEKSDTILRAYHNYYPELPFVAARLFFRDNIFFGYGFCEMLAMLQEEVSQIHNNRRDNSTIANTKIWRVDPDSKLHQGYKIYPSAMLPALMGEIESLDAGQVSPMTIDEERLTLELAEKRSGVAPPIQGSGAGTNTKRGVYTAMGTLSLLQEGNTRTDLNVTDIRYAHTKLGRILAKEFASFGIGEQREGKFGKATPKIIGALRAIDEDKIALPIYAATASVNREVEKQNDIMMMNLMYRHYQTITQMSQGAMMPGMPPAQQKYILEASESANKLAKIVLRHFGYDEVDSLVPDTPKPQAPAPSQPPAPGAPGPQGGGGTPSPATPPLDLGALLGGAR